MINEQITLNANLRQVKYIQIKSVNWQIALVSFPDKVDFRDSCKPGGIHQRHCRLLVSRPPLTPSNQNKKVTSEEDQQRWTRSTKEKAVPL
jgi:hypothetical protein